MLDRVPGGHGSMVSTALLVPVPRTVPSALPKYTGPPLSPSPAATPPLSGEACTSGKKVPADPALMVRFTARIRSSQCSPVNDPEVHTTRPTTLGLLPVTRRLEPVAAFHGPT